MQRFEITTPNPFRNKKPAHSVQSTQRWSSPFKNRNLFQTTQKILKETNSLTPAKKKKRCYSESIKKKTISYEKLELSALVPKYYKNHTSVQKMLQQYKNSLERGLKQKVVYSALSEDFPAKQNSLVVRSQTKQLNYRETDTNQKSQTIGSRRVSRIRGNPRKQKTLQNTRKPSGSSEYLGAWKVLDEEKWIYTDL